MASDFEELLTAKGMTIRGPFTQVGEMLYNDKQNSDFILEMEIDFDFSGVKRTTTRNVEKPSFGELLVDANTPTTISYTYKGSGSFTSTLVLVAKSSNFQEKLWKKNITLPETPFNYTGSRRWSEHVSFFSELNRDNVVYNAFARALMAQYESIFQLIEKQIEVEELNSVKLEAHEVDRKN